MVESIIKLAWVQFQHLHLGAVLVPWSSLFSEFLRLVSHSRHIALSETLLVGLVLTSGSRTGTQKWIQPPRLAPSGREHREIRPARRTRKVLGKYTPVDLSVRVTMGQNPSKHSDYMQVLKTLLRSSGVEISHSFKNLFSATENYCYRLDPDKETLRHEEWQKVMCCLCCAYRWGEKIPLGIH